MDIEKYAGGKVYTFFEWAFKLIIWNLLSLLIVALFAGIPSIAFYKVQKDYSIKDIRIENTQLEVILNNDNKTIIGNYIENNNNYNIEDIRVETDYIYFDLKNVTSENEYTVAIKNKDKYIEIDKNKTYFNNQNELIIYGMKKETNLGNIFNSNISLDQSKIDINNNVVICLENGTKINYGNKIKTQSTLCGILIIIAILLALFAFIPCYLTIFSMIKIFSENGSTSTFVLFFDRLWDNFKSIYKIELIIIPAIAIMSFALYFYYQIINVTNNKSFFLTFSYSFILITILIFLLWFVNLPMTIGYFRMRTLTIMKFTLIMTFKNILFTFAYLILLTLPLIICFVNSFFIPIWFLIGISLPELIMYLISAKKYRYLVQNLDIIKEDDLEE